MDRWFKMKQKTQEKIRAIAFRRRGYSLREIADATGVAKSSVSIWVRNTSLDPDARTILTKKAERGRLNGAATRRQQVTSILTAHHQNALKELSTIALNNLQSKILCSLIYWCEGTKNHYEGATFINSDPQLVHTFMHLFRKSFRIEESKLRACIHLHEYHDPNKQLAFWSYITNIPPHQFIKPYMKPHTGKRTRKNYPGCISIRYGSNDTARQLLATAKAFFETQQDI